MRHSIAYAFSPAWLLVFGALCAAERPAYATDQGESLLGVTGQGATMLPGAEPRRILHGRHENQTIHDENGMRHYYNEWGKWMDRMPSDPERPYLAPLPAAAAE